MLVGDSGIPRVTHRRSNRRRAALFLGLGLFVACARPSGELDAERSAGTHPASTTVSSEPSHATIAIFSDANVLAPKLDVGGSTLDVEYGYVVNSPLVVYDPRGTPHPRLAVDLPSRDDGTWTVNPDGTMATAWRIRPNALWHDGQPVTSRDFAFALGVYLDPDVTVTSRDPERLMDGVEPMDDKTFVIHWKQPYPWANRLLLGQLDPLPEHLIGALYRDGDKGAFEHAAFWSSPSYVSTGAYRLQQWDKGVQLVFGAFDGYFLGRPGIDQIVFRIIADANIVVANVLSGTVDTTVGTTLNQQGESLVKERWDQTRDGTVVFYPTSAFYARIQQDPTKMAHPGLQDVRVRRAIVHGIDRVSITEAVSPGVAPDAGVLLSPNNPLYVRAQQAAAKYDFDRARARALLVDAGWALVGQGRENAAGQPFTLEIAASTTADNERVANIIASDLNVLGIRASPNIFPVARLRDPESQVAFPGLRLIAGEFNSPLAWDVFTTDQCPTARSQFVGSNLGCWSNPTYDRFFRIATTTLDEAERADAMLQSIQALTEDVGAFGVYYFTENLAVRKGLSGPGPRWPTQKGATWNIHEWRWD